ncbi:hypothetical protein AAIB33_06000 [Microbacterium sp. AZCO]|uniref:hypothetical protein n=1 Tax=Microbacterium sp. AZCO TaxID=3142976 RepID=UPI0031F40E21
MFLGRVFSFLVSAVVLALALASAAPAGAAVKSTDDTAAVFWQTVGQPTVAGTPTAGSTMTADPGSWVPTPDSLTYQWERPGPISGATSQTYTLPVDASPSDDAIYRVAVTAHKAGYPDYTANSRYFQVISFDGLLEAMDADATTTITGRFAPEAVTVGSALIDGFPTAGSSYVVLSTGRAGDALRTLPPGTGGAISTGLETAPQGVGGWDMSTITVSFDPPGASTCLALDYAFATEEKAGTYTKDVLTIESPTSQLSIADDHEHVIAPHNRAFDSHGQQLNADSQDLAPIPGNGIDRWSPKLTALIPLGAGSTDVVVSIQDIGDEAADSVVLLDNLRTIDDPVCGSAEEPQLKYVTLSTPIGYSGEAVVGAYLTVEPGVWGPAPVQLSYQWLRGSTPIPDATSVTYLVQAADVGYRLAAQVTGSKDGYVPLTRTGPPTETVVTGDPRITGTPVVDAVLTGDPGRFSPGGRLNYRWLRDGQPISGAVGATYRVGVADLGARISFRVTTVDATPVEKRTSAPTARVGLATFAVVPAPTVSGVRSVGGVLTAHTEGWSPEPGSVIYEWRRDGVAIPGAVSRRYTVVAADEGARIDVKTFGLRLGYVPGVSDSADGPPIAPAP